MIVRAICASLRYLLTMLVNRQTDGQMDRQTDRWTITWIGGYFRFAFFSLNFQAFLATKLFLEVGTRKTVISKQCTNLDI